MTSSGTMTLAAVTELRSKGHYKTTSQMKPISASIVILSASVLIVGGARIQHDGTQLFVMIVGCGVGLAGLWGWFVLKEK